MGGQSQIAGTFGLDANARRSNPEACRLPFVHRESTGQYQDMVKAGLHGHNHNVPRSHALRCASITVNGFDPTCVADSGADRIYAKGAGTVVVISGTFGQCCYRIDSRDPELRYFAAVDGTSVGFWTYTVSPTSIAAQFIRTGTKGGKGITDSFSIVAPQ